MEPCNVIARASRRIGSWEPWCNVHDRNPMDCIAELEAELTEYRSAEHIYGKHFAERAEKAEAEVERLGSHLRLHCHEEDASKCYYEGVNPSGEPLGRKERDEG